MQHLRRHVVKPDDLHLLKSLHANDVNGLIASFMTHQKRVLRPQTFSSYPI